MSLCEECQIKKICKNSDNIYEFTKTVSKEKERLFGEDSSIYITIKCDYKRNIEPIARERGSI